MPVPDGDVLVHGGDLTGHGDLADVEAFDACLSTLPHRHKVVIAGNHDFCFEREPEKARALLRNARYLEDEAIKLEGLTFYGSPWQPWFYDWAFNLHRGEPLREVWSKVLTETDVLITHGPPKGILDRTSDGLHAGCEELLVALERVRPRLHVFGHIHEAYGRREESGTVFVNASTCTLGYEPSNAPIVVDL